MAHGGTDKYYSPSNKIVNDGDTAYADDLNKINYAVDSSFEQVADDLDSIEITVSTVISKAQKWATNNQGVLPDALYPGKYSSYAYALEAKEWTNNAEGAVIHLADGTTVVAQSAKVGSEKAAVSAAAALVSETNAAASEAAALISETNAAASEAAALASENAAALSETNALASENAAALSETNAATSETNAAASELMAYKWADELEDVVVSGGEYSSYHWAKKSEGYRDDFYGVADLKADKTLLDTGAIISPGGTTAERPTDSYYYIRYNTDLNGFEGYDGSAWGSLGGGATGGGSDKVFVENDMIVTADYTITSGKSASSVGPITINDGVTVTVPDGSRWVIL